jgi:Fungal protein kinase
VGDVTQHAKLKINKHQLAIAADPNNPLFPADLELNIAQGEESEFETLILKDSWPLVDRATEGDMFRRLAGHFGLPNVVHTYTVSHLHEEDRTDSLFPSDATPSSLWGGTVSVVPESRIHKRIIIATHGRPLNHAAGPRQMTLGVLHAMLGKRHLLRSISSIHCCQGHWILLMEGWLHRDVSIGNVLLLLQPEPRGPVPE